MKIRKFLAITLSNVMVALSKCVVNQGGVVLNSYDERIVKLENGKQTIEQSFNQVIEEVCRIKMVKMTQFSIK